MHAWISGRAHARESAKRKAKTKGDDRYSALHGSVGKCMSSQRHIPPSFELYLSCPSPHRMLSASAALQPQYMLPCPREDFTGLFASHLVKGSPLTHLARGRHGMPKPNTVCWCTQDILICVCQLVVTAWRIGYSAISMSSAQATCSSTYVRATLAFTSRRWEGCNMSYRMAPCGAPPFDRTRVHKCRI